LIWTSESDEARVVGTAFDIGDSDLPLRADFPIFIANAVSWLLPGREGSDSSALRGGDLIRGEVSATTGEVSVLRPDGTSERVVAAEGRYAYFNTDEPGLYRVTPVIADGTAGSERSAAVTFAVNIESSVETDIRPRASGSGTDEEPSGTTSSMNAPGERRPIWTVFIAIGCLLLIGEWYLWWRREWS
jgi:hypothetical protein